VKYIKYLKIAIAVCGAVGLAGLIIPIEDISLLKVLLDNDKVQFAVYTAMFALPIAMGVLALVKPPMQSWQAGVALASFVLAATKVEVWTTLSHLASAEPRHLVTAAAVVIGAICAIVALMRPSRPLLLEELVERAPHRAGLLGRLVAVVRVRDARRRIDAVRDVERQEVVDHRRDAGGPQVVRQAVAVGLVADHRLGDDHHDHRIDQLAVAVEVVLVAEEPILGGELGGALALGLGGTHVLDRAVLVLDVRGDRVVLVALLVLDELAERVEQVLGFAYAPEIR